MAYHISQGRVDTVTHPSGEVGNSVAVLLHIYFSISLPKIVKIQCSLTKLLQK